MKLWTLKRGPIGEIPENAEWYDKAVAALKKEMAKRMKIYIAAPVVGNSADVQNQIYNVANLLTSWEDEEHYKHNRGYDIYLPSQLKVPNAWGMTMNEWGRCVFTLDVVELDRADWVVVCDFGRQNTAGTSWEAGYAFGKGKKILLIKMPEVQEQSLMVACCAANSIDYADLMKLKEMKDIGYLFTERGRNQKEGGTVLN